MSISQTPTYNLKVILKETGISADTLRAWERRYGLPKPGRTPGGHRLYSQYDIETVKWLMSRQKEGLSISRAVDLWKELLASGQNPLAEYRQIEVPPLPTINLENARKEWLKSCLNFDEVAAEQVLNQVFATNSIEIVTSEVIKRGLFEIGELWYEDKASVQQEHFASELAIRRLNALINAAPLPTQNGTILAACPPEEEHIFPLLMITLFLRRRGWKVTNLGANVPLARMGDAIESIHPSLVVLSAQQLTTAVNLREMARLLGEVNAQTAYGGRIFNRMEGLRGRIPGHFLGITIEAAIQSIESLITHPLPVPDEKPVPSKEHSLAESFRQQRGMIESTLIYELESNKYEFEHLSTANYFLGNTLTAALEMGSASYLSIDLDWLRILLTPRGVPAVILPQYLSAYQRAISQTMGQESESLLQWIEIYRQQITNGLGLNE